MKEALQGKKLEALFLALICQLKVGLIDCMNLNILSCNCNCELHQSVATAILLGIQEEHVLNLV